MHWLRYVSYPMLKESKSKLKAKRISPVEVQSFLESVNARPLYSCSVGLTTKVEHWVSEDGITIYTYIRVLFLITNFEITTRFADGTGIVSIEKMQPKKNTTHLLLESDFPKSWWAHRSEIEKKIETTSVIERGTVEQAVTFERYWLDYLSTSAISIILIFIQLAFVVGYFLWK